MKTLLLVVVCNFFGTVCLAQTTSFQIDQTKLIQPITQKLDSIYDLDQSVRMAYMKAVADRASPKKIDSLLQSMRQTDARNLEKVESIIKQYGWLSPQQVGINGAQGLFLVIQHANLKTQDQYLPMIREAEKRGEILSSNLAILEDRINMRHGRKQIYGSQGITDETSGKKYIYPILDVDGLDQRRKSMGMPPMSEYVKDWDIEKYKRELPELERIVKSQSIK